MPLVSFYTPWKQTSHTKKRLWHRFFSLSFVKFQRTTFLTESTHVLPGFCLVFLFLSLKMYYLVKYQIIENFWFFWWLHDPGLPCRDETWTYSAKTDFSLRLHGEIKFHSGRAGHFSAWYLFRLVFIFFYFSFVSIVKSLFPFAYAGWSD